MSLIDQLGEALVRLQVVTAQQWRDARTGPADSPPLAAILSRLSASRAWWYPGKRFVPALNDYQRKQITRRTDRPALRGLSRSLRVNDYLLLGPLGKGGMGVVLKAWDLARRRYVAVKRTAHDSPVARRRFRREAHNLRRLDHPCIARFYSFEKAQGTSLLVMEYIPGTSVEKRVKARGALPWRQAARCAIDVLDALTHAHTKGVIHRDVKPANLMLQKTPAGTAIKIIDMGLSKGSGGPGSEDDLSAGGAGPLTQTGEVVGTAQYMSPEQWKSRAAVGSESDLYGLGATLFFMLAGRPPFQKCAYAYAHVHLPPPSVRKFSAGVPDALDRIVRRMLAKNPAERGSLAELRELLRQVLEDRVAPAQVCAVGREGCPTPGARRAPPGSPSPRPGIDPEERGRPVSGAAPRELPPLPPAPNPQKRQLAGCDRAAAIPAARMPVRRARVPGALHPGRRFVRTSTAAEISALVWAIGGYLGEVMRPPRYNLGNWVWILAGAFLLLAVLLFGRL